MINDPNIPATYTAALITILNEQGIAASKVLDRSGVEESQLYQSNAFLSFNQTQVIIENAVLLTGRDDLGLEVGRLLHISTHGELGMAILHSDTVLEATHTGIQYAAIRNPLLSFTLCEAHEWITIQITVPSASAVIQKFYYDMLLMCVHGIRTFILGTNAGQCKISIPYKQPSNTQLYHRYLSKNCVFVQSQACYAFHKSEYDLPSPLPNSTIRSIATKQCQAQLEKINFKDDIVTKVQKILLARPGYFPNTEEVAAKLFMSTRTLKRKLQQHNSSYQGILNHLRLKLAQEYLLDTTLSIADISELLAYSETSNFISAYKKMTGHTPSHFRLRYHPK